MMNARWSKRVGRQGVGSTFLLALTAALLMLISHNARAQPSAAPTFDDTSTGDYVIEGEYVVDFEDDIEPGTIAKWLAKLGLSSRSSALADETRVEIVRIKPSLGGRLKAIVATLRGDERVEYVEPHFRVRALFAPDDPMYRDQWHLRRVGAEAAWSGSIGRGVTVAVVDTGIACESFEGFAKATDLVQTRCVPGFNFVTGKGHANDDHGHGTHVAGTIAQSTHNGLGAAGLAFGARLMPVKVLSADGWGTTSAVADGIRWAAQHGAQVINLSLGGPRQSRVLREAVAYARGRGAIVVAAAGNNGRAASYPGASKGVIGVSATDQNDKLARFSSRGRGVDLAAPGVAVVQQTICQRGLNKCEIFPSYNGTSMASPHVAAAAAMLVGLGVTDGDEVAAVLIKHVTPLEDGAAGAGLLQAGAAVRAVMTRQLLARFAALLLALGLARRWAKKRGPIVGFRSAGFWFGAIGTSMGLLFFLPWLLGRHHLVVDLLSRPFAQWDLVLIGASWHRFLPLANALLPVALVASLLSVRRTAGFVAGFSVGTGAFLLSVVLLGQHGSPLGSLLTAVWCGLNGLLAIYVGSLLMVERKRS
jgi:serine protease